METHRVQLEVVLLLIFVNLVLTQQQVNVSLSSNSDRSALFQLRSSLGLRTRDWPRKSDPCTWTGVECRTGRVVGINVSGLKRTRLGRLNPRFAVDSLANFTRLTKFNASGFSLPGPIPNWFGQKLSALQVLDLRSCLITGTIPSSFGNLSSGLKHIDLSNNLITGNIPSTLGLLSSLSHLDLSLNFLSGYIPSSLGSLSSLRFLNFYNNSLYGSIPVQLGNLSELVKLDLGQNGLSGSLSNTLFMNLKQLENVSLSSNGFDGDILDVFWSLPRLRFLDISGNNFTGVLPNVTALFNVNSSSFNFSNNMFLGNLTPVVLKFRSIDLSGNYFQGPAPSIVGTNVVIARNCLQTIPNQRSLKDCKLFYVSRGLTFGDENPPVPAPSALPEPASNNRRRLMFILVGAFGGLVFVVIMVLLLVLLLKKCGKGNIDQRTVSTGPVRTGPVRTGGQTPPPKACINLSGLGESFTYEQMVQATGEFSDTNLIKHGHSGDIFHGTLEGGFHVVIKRVDLNSCRKDSYMLELDFFSKASHPRLVPLLGHCLENENEKLLVYKYMPNGDLSNSLYKLTDLEDDSPQSLDWITRMKIAIGAAEGLSYLHHECNPPIVHRNIQASSILLDDKYEVRLGSLSEACAQGGDTHQNMIAKLLWMPQTSEQGPSGCSSATCAYDVYCFGKVLLELVTGKLGISKSDDVNTKEWLEQNLPRISINEKDKLPKIVDQSLIVDEDLLEEVLAMAIVAKSCLNPKPSKRPLMRHILRALENPLKVVREESSSSGGLRTSSRRSWSATLFGSWRHSSSGSGNGPGQTNREGLSGLKQSSRVGSQGSGGNEYSSNSHKRLSSEIFPEPVDMQDPERQDEN